MTTRIVVRIALVALVMLTPSAAAQSWPDSGSMAGDPRVLEDGAECFDATAGNAGVTCSVLYAHIFDLLNSVPITLQRPADCLSDLATGWTGTPGVEMFWDFNQVRLTALPGFVEYGDCADEKPRRLPNHGFAPSVPMKIEGPLIGYWYLSADFDEFAPLKFDEGPDAGILPCVTVRMTLYAGRPFFDAQHNPRPLAAGETTKTIVSAGSAGSGGSALYEDAPCASGRTADLMEPENVTEFRVELTPITQNLTVSPYEGVSAKVEWFQFAPGDPDSYDKVYMQHFNQHTGPAYPNRLVFGVGDTIRIKDVAAVPLDDKLYLDILAESAWGSYDVDHATFDVHLVDKRGDRVALKHLSEPTLRFSVDHDGALKPVRSAYAWDVMAEDLEPGAYSVVVSVQNYQHTVTAEHSLDLLVGRNAFMLPPDNTLYGGASTNQDSIPAPSLAFVIAALGMLFVRAGRPIRPKKLSV